MASEIQHWDLLLVNPSLNWEQDQAKRIALRVNKSIPNQETPHIGMAYLVAAAKKEGLRVRYVDMVMDSFSGQDLLDCISQTQPALVGFTAFTVQIKSAGVLAAMIKRKFPQVKICVGGPHVSAMPQESLAEFPDFDFVISGEAERLLPGIFASLESEAALAKLPGIVTRGKKNYDGQPLRDLDSLPFPAWEEFDLSKYPGTYPHRTKLELPLISGRGCPYRCVFCCRSLGGQMRCRSVPSVIAEIEHNIEKFGCESIAFLDETFMMSRKWATDFLKTMVDRGLSKKITWSCSTHVSVVSEELLGRMKEAGCYYIFYGIESADDMTLRRIKKFITVAQIKNVVELTKKAGIVPVGSFIIGLPGDTKDHVIKDIELAGELDLYSVTFPIAVPYPGNELREMALNHQFGMRIISNDWDLYGKHDGGGIMETDDFSWQERKKWQRLAYERNPKKDFITYCKKIGQG